MAKPTRSSKPIPLPWPIGGVDENFALSDQRPGTTPSALNVRPLDATNGQRRGARRAGMSKYVAGQIADGPIQLLDVAVLPRGAAVGTGDAMTVGTTTSKVLVFPTGGGGGTATFVSAALSTANTIGKADEDNNFYVAADNSGVVQVSRLPTNHTTATVFSTSATSGAWQNSNVAPGGSYRLCGLAVNGGVVYVYMAGTAVSAIYRLNAVTGALMDATAWMTQADGLPVVALGLGSRNMLAIGSGLLGVLGTVGADPLVLEQIDIDTKTINHTSALSVGYGPFNGFLQHLNICVDVGANFYVAVLTSDDGVTNFHSRLHRIHWDGTVITKTDSASPAGTVKGIYDVTYNAAGNSGAGLLGVVGLAINGTTNSFQQLTPETLVTANGYQPYTITPWARVAADGLGSYMLRRAAASADVAKTSGTTNTWTYDSSANTTGWIASTNVAPAAVSTTATLRLPRELAIVNGALYRFDSGYSDLIQSGFCSGASAATTFQPATVVWSAHLGFKVYFVDGFNYPTYDFSTNLVGTLTATAGSVPVDSNGRKPRLCETWRGRLVLAGMLSDPQKWFMSKVGDPTNWDYAPATPSNIDAVSQTNARALQVGDVINGMVPCGDNILIFLCEHSIWRLTGDPLDGGVLTQVSSITGGAWGRAWCQDPAGNVYFYGSNGSVWQMAPTGAPTRLSLAIDAPRLFKVDLSKHIINMAWDDRWKGVRLFISPYDSTDDTTHYWWDADTKVRLTIEIVKTPGSWWPDHFENKNHNPLCVYALDADASESRVILIGTRNGYILKEDPLAKSDDGTSIESFIILGPVKDGSGFPINVNDLQVILGESSSAVNYTFLVGPSSESAFNADGKFPGTLSAGRNHSQSIRISDHVVFVKYFSAAKAPIWSVEHSLIIASANRSLVAQRQF